MSQPGSNLGPDYRGSQPAVLPIENVMNNFPPQQLQPGSAFPQNAQLQQYRASLQGQNYSQAGPGQHYPQASQSQPFPQGHQGQLNQGPQSLPQSLPQSPQLRTSQPQFPYQPTNIQNQQQMSPAPLQSPMLRSSIPSAAPSGPRLSNPQSLYSQGQGQGQPSVLRRPKPESAGFLSRMEQKHKSYGYRTLFRFSKKSEMVCMLFGLLCALGAGVCIALMVYLFGELTNRMVLIDMIRQNSEFNETYGKNPPFCVDIIPFKNLPTNKTSMNSLITEYVNSFAMRHIILAVLLGFLSIVYFMIWFICGERQINRLSIAYFEAMIRKDMKWLDTRQEDSDCIHNVVEHTQRIRDGIGERVAIVGFLMSVFGACMALAFFQGWELTMVLFLAIPLLILATYIVATMEANLVIEESKGYSKARALVQEILLNIRAVMVYGGQKRELAQFNRELDIGQNKILRRIFYVSVANGLIWFLTFAYYALFFWYGTKLVIRDRDRCHPGESSYTPADLVIIFFGVMFGALNIGIAFPMIESMLIARRSAKEVFRIIDTTSEVDNLTMDGYFPSRPAVGKIELSDVFFTYPNQKNTPVLRGVDFTATPGMTVALVGPKGSGKSTILKLLTKEYLADSGFIKLDGIDIRAYNTTWLRSQIAVVTQESTLFDDTIYENVRTGNPHSSSFQIHGACQEANAHNFITQLKEGYQTRVGYQGSKLSASQRQRIALARALLRNPRILLLDEPTSALDSQSEAVVQNALKKASKNRTTFYVAHRLNTIVNSDLVLVFHRGKIIESGKHFDLIKNPKSSYYVLATGLYNKPSVEEPTKQDDEKMSAAVLYRQSRSSLRILDNIICSPYRNPHVFPVSDKVLQKLQKKTIGLVKEVDSDELIFSINPLPFGGQGDMYASAQNTFGNKNHPAMMVEMTTHTDSDIRIERTMWAYFLRKAEPESLDRPGLIQQQQQFLPQQIQYTVPVKENVEFIRVLRMVSSNFILILMGIIASIVLGVALPSYGLLFGHIIAQLSNKNMAENTTKCAMLALLFLFVAVVAGIAAFGQSLTLRMAGFKAVNYVRKRLMFAMLRHDAGWFEDPEHDISSLTTRLNNDAGNIKYISPSLFGVLFQCLATVVIAVAYSAYYAWRLTAYCVFLIIFVIGSSWLDGWLSKSHQQKTNETMEELARIVCEVFDNRQAVLTSQLERYFIMKFERVLLLSGKSGWKIRFGRSIGFGISQATVFVAFSICIFIAGFEMTRPGTPVKYGDVLKVGEGLIFALLTVGTSLSIIPNLWKSVVAGNRILKILKTKPKWEYDTAGQQIPSINGAVDFKNVNFWYPHATDVHILKGISFSVKPGQTVALVGSTGSGKSSSAHLILRFHDVNSGAVEIDGMDWRNLNCASLRNFMALVEQQPLLFHRTVEENIAYGDNTRMVSVEEVIAAAKATNIHSFITSLPEGYQTRIGGSGSLLSMGQKQQISIARALIRNPRILVINEATGALDHESEIKVWETLDMARKGRTCIVVSHHLKNIQTADLIIVMHQGSIIEFGKHDALLSKRGLYFLLWTAQNPLLNDNFMGTFNILNIFGRNGGDDIIDELAKYAQTAIATKPKDVYAPTAVVAGTEDTSAPTVPTAQDELCNFCNIFGMK